jgi:hypothetical protein
LLLTGFDANRLSIMLHNSSTTFKSGLLEDGIWRNSLFVFFQLFSLKPSFGGEDRLWEKNGLLQTDRAWNSLSTDIFSFHFSQNLLVRKCEILKGT